MLIEGVGLTPPPCRVFGKRSTQQGPRNNTNLRDWNGLVPSLHKFHTKTQTAEIDASIDWTLLQGHYACNDGHTTVQKSRATHASDRSPAYQHGRRLCGPANERSDFEQRKEEKVGPLF